MEQTGEDVDQGALAGAVGSNDSQKRSGLDLKTDVPQDRPAPAVAERNVFCLNRRRHASQYTFLLYLISRTRKKGPPRMAVMTPTGN